MSGGSAEQVGFLVGKMVAAQRARVQAALEPLTDAELGRVGGVSAGFVRDHVPREWRAMRRAARPTVTMAPLFGGSKRGEDKAREEPKPAQPAEAPPAPEAPKADAEQKPKGSYVAGVSCGRGKHNWVDKGSYFRCEGGANPGCRSTRSKQKPKAAPVPAPEAPPPAQPQ